MPLPIPHSPTTTHNPSLIPSSQASLKAPLSKATRPLLKKACLAALNRAKKGSGAHDGAGDTATILATVDALLSILVDVAPDTAAEAVLVAQLANNYVSLLVAAGNYVAALPWCDAALSSLRSTPCAALAAIIGGEAPAGETDKENRKKIAAGKGAAAAQQQYIQMRAIISLRYVQMCSRARNMDALSALDLFVTAECLPWLQALPSTTDGGAAVQKHLGTLSTAVQECRSTLHKRGAVAAVLRLTAALGAVRV